MTADKIFLIIIGLLILAIIVVAKTSSIPYRRSSFGPGFGPGFPPPPSTTKLPPPSTTKLPPPSTTKLPTVSGATQVVVHPTVKQPSTQPGLIEATTTPTTPTPSTSALTLDKLKAMTPAQISMLSKAQISVFNKYQVNMHGIPMFPTLGKALSQAQYNAFWGVFNPAGNVY